MNLKLTYPLALLLSILFFYGCTKEAVDAPEAQPVRTYERIAGFVQKGPFLNGTSIQLAELTTSLAPTGSSFTAQIADNTGSFALRNVQLGSPYVQLRADGFYYNEVTDESSSAQLTLYALSDITQHDALNVNLLSHLEKARVEYLLDEGTSFSAAKAQAQREIFAIFGIEQEDAQSSELLDISLAGTDNAKLLAISVILQGYLDVADFSELLANISTDIREDGTLESSALGSQLINNATLLRPAVIREQLEARYAQLGQNAAIPDFEIYVASFIETTAYEQTNAIRYAEQGAYGPNLLDTNLVTYTQGHYSLHADLPASTQLRVKIAGSNWAFGLPSSDSGWDYTDREESDTSRVFTTNRTGAVDLIIDLHIEPRHPDYQNPDAPLPPRHIYTRMQVYENNALEPIWEKTFVVTYR
ncbi:hypothetical protein [Neolewinella maritima]|uniref:hypothetical protein n=1 Tax=Neolewinella maritima TaxID=1383882 RepID=UPI001EE945F4|nr:hypothetical protein [Neolewinella maritima]